MSIRATRSQKKIFNRLQQLEGEISAQQLYLQLRQQGSPIGLATVYRTLKSLHLEGKIQERITPVGESLYSVIEETHSHHHHHLNCVQCGQSIPIEDCPITHKLTQWCQSQHFTVYYHTLEFFGICDACQHQLEG